MKVLLRAKILAITVLSLIALGTSEVYAEGSFTLSPDKNIDAELGRYQLEVKPGQELEFDFFLTNVTKEPVDIIYYPADAYPMSGGGRSFTFKTEKPRSAGSWMSPQGVVKETLKPKEEKKLTYKVKIPDDILPGEYVAVLGAEEFIPSYSYEEIDPVNKIMAAIDADNRKGVQVVFQYRKEEALRQMTIDSFNHSYTSNGEIELYFELSNRGTILERPSGLVAVRDANDKVVFSKNYDADSIYGNTTAEMKYEMGSTYLPKGKYSVYYEAVYTTDRVSRTFYFDVTESQAKNSSNALVAAGLKSDNNFPWLAAGLGALGAFLMGLFVWIIIFLKRKKEDEEKDKERVVNKREVILEEQDFSG